MDELTQKYFEALLRTQFLPSERLRQYQRGLMEKLVRHARTEVPLYRDSGRLDVLFTHDDRIDWERWDDIPVLTRAQAAEHTEALYAETVPPECGAVVSSYTAGSTGTALAYRNNAIAAAAGSAALERGLVWAGLPEQLTLAWLISDKQSAAPYPAGEVYRTVIRGAPRLIHRLVVRGSTKT
jgi:phenylacetate-CoA ligase